MYFHNNDLNTMAFSSVTISEFLGVVKAMKESPPCYDDIPGGVVIPHFQ